MKKRILTVAFLFILLFGFLALPCCAADEHLEDFTEALPDGFDEDTLSNIGVDSLLSELISAFRGGLGEALPFFALLFGVALLLSLAEPAGTLDGGVLSPHMSVGVGAVASLFIFTRLLPLITEAEKSLRELSLFFSGLIPIMSGILLSGGNASSAAAQAANMNITFSLVSLALSRLLLPLCSALFALALLSATDGGASGSLAKSIKGLYMWMLGIGTTVIISAVSMQSVISSAKDSAYLRAAKYAASGMIPIVGSTVSGALSTLAGGLSYVKSTVGASSVFVIAVLALAPLLKLLLCRGAFSLSISFSEFVSAHSGVKIFTAFRSALDALTALYSAVAVIYIAEAVIFLKSGVSVFG